MGSGKNSNKKFKGVSGYRLFTILTKLSRFRNYYLFVIKYFIYSVNALLNTCYTYINIRHKIDIGYRYT